jgi:hypothetical protein
MFDGCRPASPPLSPRPLRLGADQPHTGTAGIEVHLPIGGEERLDVLRREVRRCTVRAVDHAHFTQRRQRRAQARGKRSARRGIAERQQVQHVAGSQRAAAMPTELTERERALAPEVVRQLQAAAQREVAARAPSCHGAERQRAAGRNEERRVHGLCDAAQEHRQRRARDGHHGVGPEAQLRTAYRDFQPGRALRVAEQPVAETQRTVIHRARGRNAHGPVTLPARPVLHGGLRAGG